MMEPSGQQSSRKIWAVVPAKAFVSAKQRLSGVLGDWERAELARTMFQDVLATLFATPRIAEVLVVTSDAEVARLATDAGARIVNDDGKSGLNHAVALGRAVASAEAVDVLIVPTDVPFATIDEVNAVIDRLYDHDVVLVPALSDGGTNAVGLRLGTDFTPRFGEDSFVRHQADATRHGIRLYVSRLEGLEWDIDCAADLTVPEHVRAGNRTANFLRQFAVSRRTLTDIQTRIHTL